MAKQSQLEKAIAVLESEIAFRQHAIAALKAQQSAKPAKARKPKPAAAPDTEK